MPAKAVIAPSYRWRLLLLTALFTGFGLYFAYDGFIGYPAQNRDAENVAFQHNMFVKSYGESHPTASDADVKEAWIKEAHAQGLPTEPPRLKTEADIGWQKAFMLITLPIGLYFLWVYIGSFSRWVGTSETGLESSAKMSFPFTAIKQLDKSRWDRKGIAVVRAEHEGKPAVVVLDDWKYDRYATRTILLDVEAHLSDEQIVNGKRESAGETPAGEAPAAPSEAVAPPSETTG